MLIIKLYKKEEQDSWSISLENGKFACGRVIEIEPDSRTGFLTGLMDWLGDTPPVADDIKGCKVLSQGSVHIKTVHETGLNGKILDYLPLTEDDITPFFFKSQEMFEDECLLMQGYNVMRPASKEESVTVKRGPRNKMIRLERRLVERYPGPENKERWAGKRKRMR